ncbi:MAG: regulatory protein RecX [Flavobacteriales bacterium]
MEEDNPKKKRYTPQQAWPLIQNFCAYRERCHQEIRDKLYSYSLTSDDVENIIVKLIEEKYLDEERYARAFVSGKYRIKKWGRSRIVRELKMRKISEYCIKKGLEEIDPDEYYENLKHLVEKKYNSIKGDHSAIKRKKTAHYLITKGYEGDLVWDVVKEM